MKAKKKKKKNKRSTRSLIRKKNCEMVLNFPVPVAAQSKASTVFGRSNIGIAGLNPVRGMDVFPRFAVLCCPV
jgi:hypothetical protein